MLDVKAEKMFMLLSQAHSIQIDVLKTHGKFAVANKLNTTHTKTTHSCVRTNQFTRHPQLQWVRMMTAQLFGQYNRPTLDTLTNLLKGELL